MSRRSFEPYFGKNTSFLQYNQKTDTYGSDCAQTEVLFRVNSKRLLDFEFV